MGSLETSRRSGKRRNDVNEIEKIKITKVAKATIAHEFTMNITCPWCGHENSDSWEVDFGSGTSEIARLDCAKCEKIFLATRLVTVDYSTERIEDDEDEEEQSGADKA